MVSERDRSETPVGAEAAEADARPSPSGPTGEVDALELERLEAMLERTLDVPVLAEAVERQEAADAADTLEKLEEEQAAEVLVRMDDQLAAAALSEMQIPMAVSVMEDLVEEDPAYGGRLLTVMAPDDAVDLLQALEEGLRERLLAALPVREAIKLRRLFGYDQESAGGLMTTGYVVLRDDMTVSEATDVIRGTTLPEGMQHLFVENKRGQLVGRVGLRELLLDRPSTRLEDIMNPAVRAVRYDVDQETVAKQFDRYDYYMLAVVDEDDHLLGIITVDDVIDIIRAEQTEDVQMTVGAGAGEAVYSGLAEKFRGRFPWLAISLLMTCIAALVVLVFEELVGRLPVLAFLMPVIAALVGNAGHQALAVTLRGIVLDEVRRERVWPLVAREGAVGLINGMMLGLLIFGGMSLLPLASVDGWKLGLIAGLATMVAMSVGTLAGSSIPLVMRRLGFDPAQSSAIFLIMITDAVSFSALLGLTFAMARHL